MERNEIASDKWGDAVESFSNLLRDAKHLKVANFGLSLPKYDSASENISSARSMNGLSGNLTKAPHVNTPLLCKLVVSRASRTL